MFYFFVLNPLYTFPSAKLSSSLEPLYLSHVLSFCLSLLFSPEEAELAKR